MRIEVRRTGGFAGVARTFAVDTSTLSAARAARIEQLVVVSGAGRFHGADGDAVHARRQQSLADEPARLRRALFERVLPDQNAEDVGEVLVERARLATVDERRGALRHAVGQLVGDDVDAFGEALEQLSVAVAVNHLPPVPLRVVEVRAVVHARV